MVKRKVSLLLIKLAKLPTSKQTGQLLLLLFCIGLVLEEKKLAQYHLMMIKLLISWLASYLNSRSWRNQQQPVANQLNNRSSRNNRRRKMKNVSDHGQF